MIYRELFFIMLIMVFIADLSGFPDAVKGALRMIVHKDIDSVKPLDCSLCLTWWACLIYGLAMGCLDAATIAYIALLSCLAFPVSELAHIILGIITKAINLIAKICRI